MIKRNKTLQHLLCLLAMLLPLSLWAQTPDWSTKVAPVLFNNCTSCHHTGGIAPFSLTTYAGAVAHAGSVLNAVQQKKMPPWPPDPAYAHLAHERILSDTEIALIADWVNSGAPQGDPSLAPPEPVYHHHGTIPGTPDLVVRIPNYVSTADTADVYQCFVIPSGLLADKFIRTFEAIPGNNLCVHHVLVFTDTAGMYSAMDAAYPGPGFPYFGGVAPDGGNALGIWVPGSNPMTCPPGFGLRMAHNSDIVVQIHYPKGSAGITDSTEIHFFFAPDTGIREVFMHPLLNYEYHLIGAPLFVPANTIKKYEEEDRVYNDLSLLGVFPHTHLIAKSIKSYGVLPSGDTDRYINIPDWKFNWQNFYMFPRIKKAALGTLLRGEAVYDNTSGNAENPNNPPQDVGEGEKTTDEMMLVIFLLTAYRPGDENIVIDTGPNTSVAHQHYYHGQQLLDVVPNPAVNDIVVKSYSEKEDHKTISLLDMQGKMIRSFMTAEPMPQGYTYDFFSVQGLPAGNYILVLQTAGQKLSKKITVVAY